MNKKTRIDKIRLLKLSSLKHPSGNATVNDIHKFRMQLKSIVNIDNKLRELKDLIEISYKAVDNTIQGLIGGNSERLYNHTELKLLKSGGGSA